MAAPELTLSQLNGRFRLTDGPVALPGKCVVCGGVKGQFVDIQLDVEFYGAVIFCVTCVTEVAQIIDLVSGEKYRELEQQLADSQQALNRTSEAFDEYARNLDNMYHRFSNSLHGVFNVPDEGTEELLSDTESGTESTSGQSTESAVNERSTSVSSSESDGPDKSIFDF